jgi:hypothetical protein
MHTPLNRDAMPAFFDFLREEPHPAVRVALGHFISTNHNSNAATKC